MKEILHTNAHNCCGDQLSKIFSTFTSTHHCMFTDLVIFLNIFAKGKLQSKMANLHVKCCKTALLQIYTGHFERRIFTMAKHL